MTIERFDNNHEHWPNYVAHLHRVSMARWGITPEGLPLENTVYLGALADSHVVGHISLRIQPIQLPLTNQIIRDNDANALNELFVQTFAVEETYRRRGHGRALQMAALDLLHDLNCYQMRSWSSLDKTANYMLKISLGFAACPAIFEAPNGEKISGVYFVQTVER